MICHKYFKVFGRTKRFQGKFGESIWNNRRPGLLDESAFSDGNSTEQGESCIIRQGEVSVAVEIISIIYSFPLSLILAFREFCKVWGPSSEFYPIIVSKRGFRIKCLTIIGHEFNTRGSILSFYTQCPNVPSDSECRCFLTNWAFACYFFSRKLEI